MTGIGRFAAHLPPDPRAQEQSQCAYFERFVDWLRGLDLAPGQLYGWPDSIVDWAEVTACGGCIVRKLDDEHDDESGEPG